jgi:hypothetical protein
MGKCYARIAFGIDNSWNYQVREPGTSSVVCDVATFQDPLFGIHKKCVRDYNSNKAYADSEGKTFSIAK